MNEKEEQKCVVCEQPLHLRWTDTHGISACTVCCSPYRSYKYDEQKSRSIVCESLTLPIYVPILRRYWQETKRKIPHSFDFGIPSEEESSYSGLKREDEQAFTKFYKEHALDFNQTAKQLRETSIENEP